MLADNLERIKSELNLYSKTRRVDLFTNCINDKLKYTLLKYDNELNVSNQVLILKGSAKVLKTITRLQKEEDIKNLEAITELEGAENND